MPPLSKHLRCFTCICLQAFELTLQVGSYTRPCGAMCTSSEQPQIRKTIYPRGIPSSKFGISILADILRWDICDPEITIYYYMVTQNVIVPSCDAMSIAYAKNLVGCGEATRAVTLANHVYGLQGTFILLQRRFSIFSDFWTWRNQKEKLWRQLRFQFIPQDLSKATNENRRFEFVCSPTSASVPNLHIILHRLFRRSTWETNSLATVMPL